MIKTGAALRSGLTVAQRQDLLSMIRFNSQYGLVLSVKNMKRAILAFRRAEDGILDVGADSREELAPWLRFKRQSPCLITHF